MKNCYFGYSSWDAIGSHYSSIDFYDLFVNILEMVSNNYINFSQFNHQFIQIN